MRPDLKVSTGIVLASLVCLALMLGGNGAHAAIYELSATEPSQFADDVDVEATGTFEFENGIYSNWNIFTNDFAGREFTFTIDNSTVLKGDDPRAFLNESEIFPQDLSNASSDANGLFLFNEFVNDNGDESWRGLSLVFDGSLGDQDVLNVLPPNSPGSGFSNGLILSNQTLFLSSDNLIEGIASVQGTGTSIPVPGTLGLLCAGLVGIGFLARRVRIA